MRFQRTISGWSCLRKYLLKLSMKLTSKDRIDALSSCSRYDCKLTDLRSCSTEKLIPDRRNSPPPNLRGIRSLPLRILLGRHRKLPETPQRLKADKSHTH
jgi:hypothetical protein